MDVSKDGVLEKTFIWTTVPLVLHPHGIISNFRRRRGRVLFLLYPTRELFRKRKENYEKKVKFYAYNKI